jgi:Phage tail assembly chaperone protein
MFILVKKFSDTKNIVFCATRDFVGTDDYFFHNGIQFHMPATEYVKYEVNNLPEQYEDNKFEYNPNTGEFSYFSKDVEEKENWIKIRQIRNHLLSSSDFDSGILWPDVWESKHDLEKNAWLDYRKSLREIPQTYLHTSNVVWPEKPNFNVEGIIGVIGN